MSTPETTDFFTVSLEEVSLRLDKLLSLRFPTFSRTYFQSLIEQGSVLVNGVPCKKREKPQEDDEIEVCFLFPPELSLTPENIPLSILYEDEHLIAVNKPVGMVVHPAPGHPCGTFVNALLYHCKQLHHSNLQDLTTRGIESSDMLRPGIVHRLDKDTSGVLLAAKHPLAHQRLVARFAAREMHKTYLALCVGTPQKHLVDAPIKRHPTQRKEMAIHPEGKSAQTLITPLCNDETLSLVRAEPKTGRTHQIRVHLKHCGTPILGDTVYGSTQTNKRFETKRQLLHAHKISFRHPITETPLEITAPLPEDFKEWMIRRKFYTEGVSKIGLG